MSVNDLSFLMVERRNEIDAYLQRWLREESAWSEDWQRWCRHLMLGAGKALRPSLCFDFYAASSGLPRQRAGEGLLPLGLALEFFHTYTLVHDDLPAMDNDDFRRSRLTLHRLENEATAILMGDALLTASFELLASSTLCSDDLKWAIQNFARRLGAAGLIEGQRLDVKLQTETFEQLKMIHQLKTGQLFSVACSLGVLAFAGKNSPLLPHAARWGQIFGLLYQFLDDLMDVVSLREEIGKTPGKDFLQGKKTTLDFLNADQLSEISRRHLAELDEIACDFPSAEILRSWSVDLSSRFESALKKL